MIHLGILPSALLMHYAPHRSGYLPGEQISSTVTTVEDGACIALDLVIGKSVGSGFAGQVYEARLMSTAPPGWPGRLALKVLRPRAGWKAGLRDALFWLCFQAPFAPQVDEAAVRSGLLWQVVLCAAAGHLLGPGSVARPLGYFWDSGLCSYVEIHEWVESQPARYETDPHLIARWLGCVKSPAVTEMARKQCFMDQMTQLCHAIGALGLARQYAWYTLVSQANVLTRRWTQPGARGEFAVVDCRVGLAFPFFLPFTPVHLRIALDGLRRGALVHYDEVDFSRLGTYLETHPALAEQVGKWVGWLEQADRAYRAGLPDLWQTRTRLLTDAGFRQHQVTAVLARWVRLGLAEPKAAEWLVLHPPVLSLLMLIYLLPVIGPLIVRLVAHPGYRAHLRDWFAKAGYRRAWLDATRARDLAEWVAFERVAPGHAARLARSAPAYLLEKIAYGWLPPSIHHWLTDQAARRQWVYERLAWPFRLMTSQKERIAWLDGIVQAEQERGLIHPERAAILHGQIRQPRVQRIVRDLGFVSGLEVFSRLIYLVLALYGLSTGDLLPLGIAALSPIPPSGIPRLLYVLGCSIGDITCNLATERRFLTRRQALARLGELLVAPWRLIGNLFPLFEITAYYPRLGLLLAEYFANRALRNVPVFGGRGKLLEFWTFQLIYNVPVSLKALLEGSLE